ncbi:mucin-5AC [Ceratitis capitata]|uniref:mucin-5AC n=1 Tax=Ceratitis capitata TaxID=7213 RepID=UPI00061880A6|nr:mucin-5AC [Ceratitis capitata]
MSRTHLWLALVIALVTLAKNQCEAAPEIASADLPLEARNGDADSAEDDTLISTSYVLPNQIFNDGKPYYASKDPISGQLDFSAKKPAGIETAANEVFDPKEKIVMSSNAPNIHDYLNLPVKYSSSKFVYPLVSSSYANLKYQGSNKNYITNKKPTSVVATPVTPAPSHNYYTIPTTKLMAVPPTAPGLHSSSGSSSATAVSTSTTSTTSSTTTTTSKKPTTATSTTATKASSTSTIPPTTSTTTTTSTSTTTTAVPSSPKYTTSTRKPFPPLLSTSIPQVFDSSTRKKFIPTKKYITSTTTTSATPATPMRFPDQTAVNTTGIPKPTTTGSVSYTTRAPSSLATTTHFVPSTKQPIIFTEDPSGQLTSALPTPVHTHVPELNIADVYQTLGQKNTEQKVEQKPSMSLADIFNSLADEESAVASQNQGSQGFDAQGNYMQPISLAKPAPFAMQQQHQHQQHHQQQQLPSQQQQYNQKQQHQQQFQRLPQQPTHPTYQTHPTYPTHGTTPLPGATGEGGKVISGSKENYSGEYVSYQVQQPNVMQYRPAPGAINNVVISPGQHSASFVLGSQQQVGSAAFGSVEKEPLFSKDPPVQYGTVISEDISALSRPAQGASSSTGTYPPGAQSVSNFHQNGNFGASVAGPTPPYVQRPMGTNAPTVTYSEEPPAAPSLYQQLPLIGSNLRQRKPPKPLALPQTAQNNYQPTAPTQTPVSQVTASTESNGAQDTKELLVSTNIRFPSNEEQSNEEHSVPVIAGPPAGPQVNGHAQPLSLQQLQNANNVVFPKGSEDEMSNVAGGVSNADVLIQKHEVLTMNQHKQKLSFPPTQLDQNTPSQHMEPPPRFPPSVANAIPEQTELHKRPQLPSRPAGPSSSFAYNDYTRKPIPGITRPNPERHLPNILPQFRPNAKISSGHSPAQNFNQEPGNIRISGQTLKRPNSSPQFAHRRQPLLQQQMHRYPLNRAADFGPGSPLPSEANRRVYRLPPYGGQGVQYLDRMYPRRPLPAPQRGVDNYERHAAASNPEMYKTIMAPERLAAFEEEDLVINDPPQPVSPEQEEQPVDKTKLEPVVTLQMLQSQKKPLSLPNDDTGSGEIQVTAASEQTESQIDGIAGQNGLYVVYPSRGDKTTANSDIADIKEQLPAIAHVEPPTGSDYQNTPFSVVRDQPQEPILKNKKPQSLQQQTKSAQLVKDKFPYPIEKPDLSYSELNAPLPATVIGPRIISGTYGVGIPDTPIAIAYSPTEPSPYRRTGVNNAQRFSNVNLASSVISEIRTDTQTEEGINNDFDMRGQNLEKNFMAPFYPSVSLGSATNAPSNGWNILPSTTEQTIYEKNNINRADVGETAEYSETTTAKTFEIDSFQPELQGGFKPIYPPGYKVEEEGAHAEERKELFADENDKPLALASYMRPQSEEDVAPVQASASTSSTSTTTTTTSTTTTTTTSTTPKPATSNSTERPKNTGTPNKTTTSAESVNASTSAAATSDSNNAVKVQTTKAPSSTKKKSTFETSLAALLFGDDEEFEEDVGGEARKQQQQSQQPLSATVETKTVSAGPRTGAGAPRMGPRSLKIR